MANRRRFLRQSLPAGMLAAVGGVPFQNAEAMPAPASMRIGGSVPTIDGLSSLHPSTPAAVQVLGHFSPGDGGGGLFLWNEIGDRKKANGGTIIASQGAGRDTGTWERIWSGAIDVKWFGAGLGKGVRTDTNAVQAAIKAGTHIYFPSGTYRVDAGLHPEPGQSYRIVGDGVRQTTIVFEPVTPDNLFHFVPINKGSTLDHCSVEGLSIVAARTRVEKSALLVQDVGKFILRDVKIYFEPGAKSKGIRLQGRHESVFENVMIHAALPISIEVNEFSGHSSIDHFNFHNLSLYSQDHQLPLINVEAGVNLSNVSFSGHQPWVGGYHGLYWMSNKHDGSSINLSFQNVRWENGLGQDVGPSHGYMFYVNPLDSVNGVQFSNCKGGSPGANGFWLRRARNVTLLNCSFGNNHTTDIDVDDSCDHVNLINTAFTETSIKKTTGLERFFGETRPTTYGTSFPHNLILRAPLRDPGYYASNSGLWVMDVYQWKKTGVLEAGGVLPVPGYANGLAMATLVAQTVDASLSEFILFAVTKTGIVAVRQSENVVIGEWKGKLCVVRVDDSRVELRNLLGQPIRFVINWN